MKFLSLSILFGLLIVGAFGKGVKSFYGNAEHPGKCVYKDLILSPGEQGKPKGECQRFTCEADLKGDIENCDYRFIILEPPCWWGEIENPDLSFPKCCMRKVICPEEDNEQQIAPN
ncbi:uncharacterized protein LOC133331820 [Musca vetustissima]|uniref:uncharacterized protein LOC133331820 n=1 Tax=Musca vetustissima TaxID=27455 RepID=UPI002AB7EA1F|nr:uncharacterized protein LOC133331820 [Musca vetustissima]